MIDRETVEKVALLARLELDPDRVAPLVGELGRILQYVGMLEELDLTGIPPISHGSVGQDVFRPDTPRDPASSAEALANAPDQAEGFFRVPRVIEER